jgi:hypothetical protein
LPTSRNNSSDFYNFDGFSSVKLDKKRKDAQEKNMNSDTPIVAEDAAQGNNGTAARKSQVESNSSTPNENAGNNELTPTDKSFNADIGLYNSKLKNKKTASFMDSIDNNGEWRGFTNDDATKIFALNNWSMTHWNGANDEIT